MPLKDVSIGIKTFLRDDKLFRAVDGIQETMPEAQIIVADDGYLAGKEWISYEKEILYQELEKEGHIVLRMPFDSGFGAKSNAIAKAVLRPYLLIGSDDFDFADPQARAGIETMAHALDTYGRYYGVSGRVNNQPNEFWLDDLGDTIIERYADVTPRYTVDFPKVYDVDLTVNYTMFHRDTFREIGWDKEALIGQGEHGSFFVDLKRAGFKIGFIPGVNINEQSGRDSDEYYTYRYRARSSERSCFVKRGIKKYILADGTVDYEE
jgi:GT2 family glycosyltransferase